jgi:hypothetical protein
LRDLPFGDPRRVADTVGWVRRGRVLPSTDDPIYGPEPRRAPKAPTDPHRTVPPGEWPTGTPERTLPPGSAEAAAISHVPVAQVLQQAAPSESVVARLAKLLRRSAKAMPAAPLPRRHPAYTSLRAGALKDQPGVQNIDPGMARRTQFSWPVDRAIHQDTGIRYERTHGNYDVTNQRALRPVIEAGIRNWVAGHAPGDYTARLNSRWREDADQPLVRLPTAADRARYARALAGVVRDYPAGITGGQVVGRLGRS